MKLYTAHITKGKTIPTTHGIPVLDVTVKSGDKAFAPTWDFLMAYKNSAKDVRAENDYTHHFLAHMRESFKRNTAHWRAVLERESLCLLCYCPAGAFCHRLILVDIYEKQCKHWGIPFTYGGEITKETKPLL